MPQIPDVGEVGLQEKSGYRKIRLLADPKGKY